jgi:branched-chain amino acid transport system permease protein
MDQLLSSIISILFHGTAYAMILYIVSVGLSVTMGLMGFANLAHGVFAMAGGYVTVTMMNSHSVPFVLALVIACIVVALASIVLERLLYARLYNAGELEQVLFTIGLIFMATAAAKFIWGPLPQRMSVPDIFRQEFTVGRVTFPAYRAFILVAGLVIFGALWLALERTNFGARIRAAVDNRRMAQSLGINTGLLFTSTFALGSALAALGGGLGAEILAINPGYAFEHLVYFLIVVAVGGLGRVTGVFVAALLIGVLDFVLKKYLPQGGTLFIYAITILLLLWRPQGLFGSKTA